MERLHEKLFQLIGEQIYFNEEIFEPFFNISSIRHDNLGAFRQEIYDFAFNKEKKQRCLVKKLPQSIAADINRLAKLQLDAYIKCEKNQIVAEYLAALRCNIEKFRMMPSERLRTAEYALILAYESMRPEEIDARTLRNVLSSMVMFYDLLYNKSDIDRLADEIDFAGICSNRN